ncbi:MAG: sensor histidine kinase, partial [Candidatus Eremiobacteraeota bacterium]|nr:sensor histidine kinase [Candidatus Eremiobacteraeota bacterium]
RLGRRGRAVELAIEDNGAGFARADDGRGQGIVGMRERAQLAGGALRISGARGRGTKVVVALAARNGSA